jgi:class 3 adenylate cyclase
MSTSPVKRRLAAIMSIDVVSYSAMMGADEEGTLRLLRAHRTYTDNAIRNRGGRIANTAGDSILAEFSSPVEAVRCAVEIQAAVADMNAKLPPDRHMRFRIGVHLDDVIVQDNGDLIGEGVNIAARLQAAGDPGGVMVSGEVASQARAKLPELGFAPVGESVFKNILRTVEAFRIVTGAAARDVARAQVSSTAGLSSRQAKPEGGGRGAMPVILIAVGGLALVVAAALVWLFVLRGPTESPVEAAAWNLVKQSTRSADVAAFLERFPKGFRAEEAKARLVELRAQEAQRAAAEAEERRRQEEAARAEAARTEAARKAAAQDAARRRDARLAATRHLDWKDVPCARSRLTTVAGMSCNATSPYEGHDGRGRFQRSAAGVHAGGMSTYVLLIEAADAASVHEALNPDDEDDFIIEISNFTRNNARSWSPLVSHAGGYFATFTAVDGRSCTGFVKPGPARGAGLEWVIRGYHCVPAGRTLQADQIRAVMDAQRPR